jgi:hypothetical protein
MCFTVETSHAFTLLCKVTFKLTLETDAKRQCHQPRIPQKPTRGCKIINYFSYYFPSYLWKQTLTSSVTKQEFLKTPHTGIFMTIHYFPNISLASLTANPPPVSSRDKRGWTSKGRETNRETRSITPSGLSALCDVMRRNG